MALHLAAVEGSHYHLFGHRLNCNWGFSRICFRLNKSLLAQRRTNVLLDQLQSAVEEKMKSQARHSVCFKAIFQSRGGVFWNANCFIEIWLLVLLATNCSKRQQQALSWGAVRVVSSLSSPELEHGSSVIFMTHHLLPSSSLSSSLDVISHHHQS